MRVFCHHFFRILGYILVFIISSITVGYFLIEDDFEIPNTVGQDVYIPHVVFQGRDGKNVTHHLQTFGNPDNEPIIFVHGGPGIDFRYLLKVVGSMSKDYFLVFYDQRGTGYSPRVSFWELNGKNLIDDLDVMIDYTLSTLSPKHNKVHLIGHSWGAIMIPMYISEHYDPENPKVDKIVLCEPGMLSKEASRAFMEESNGMIPPISFKGFYECFKIFLGFLHVRGPDMQARFDYVLQRTFVADIPHSPIRNYFYKGIAEIEMFRYSFWSGILVLFSILELDDESWNFVLNIPPMKEKVEQKVLLLTSDSNILIGREYQEKYHKKLFNDVDIFEVSNAAHFMFTDNTDEAVGAVLQYLGEE